MTQIWTAKFQIKREDIFKVQENFWEAFEQISIFGDDDTPFYDVSVTYQGDKNQADMTERLSVICTNANVEMPIIEFEKIPDDIDWLERVYDENPSVEAGRFFVHDSHVIDLPKDKITISINAATAFGTGEHGTTKGCLLALDILLQVNTFKRPLDMGCGSGVLGIAAAKALECPVIAIDNDDEAVRVTIQNSQINAVKNLIGAQCGDGFKTPSVIKNAPYDLMLANILARPLIDMADELVSVLDINGFVIVSGLLKKQEDAVVSAYRELGLNVIATYPIDEWQTVVLKKS